MANRTAWVAGLLNAGLGWTGLFSSSDFNSISSGSSALSLITITNGTGLDMFMDISLIAVCAQTTTTGVTAGSNIALWIMPLLQDGATFGDGSIPTAGASGQVAKTPSLPPAAIIGVQTGISATAFAGAATGILLPPGTFRMAIQNNTGVSWGGAQACYFRSYNINLNS